MDTNLSASGVSSVMPPMPSNVLPVPLIGQQTPMWCWAASTQMALQYMGIGITQCAEANQLFNLTTCCELPTPTECVRGGSPQLAYWGVDFKHTAQKTALSYAQLQAQIDANTPVIFSWSWLVKGGHVMVAVGYVVDEPQQYVIINNPMPVNMGDQQIITYADYVANPNKPQAHTHGRDFYDLSVATVSEKVGSPDKQNDMANDDATPALHADVADAADAGLRMAYLLLKNGSVVPTAVSDAITSVEQLSLGKPLSIHTVDYDRLKTYDGVSDPKSLFEAGEGNQRSVLFGGKIVSSIVLRSQDGKWVVSSAGGVNGMNNIQAALLRIPAHAAEAYIVQVPWLDRIYLAYEEAGQTHIAHIYDDAQAGFTRFAVQPATEVFKKLVPLAQDPAMWDGQI